MYKIAIVEDDPALAETITNGLMHWGYEPLRIDKFDDIVSEFVRIQPHLLIMDINLPCYDGFYWCKKIREVSEAPVIFLSSRSTNMDVIMAVNLGGDDYITKPFSMDILTAKIAALLRRTYAYHDGAGETLECREAVLNLDEGVVYYKNARMELTRNELKILGLLMRNRGKIISREQIMRILWNNDEFVNDNTLTVNINRLRSKMAEIDLPDFILTKKGEGYMVA